jgi:hypothetical protein
LACLDPDWKSGSGSEPLFFLSPSFVSQVPRWNHHRRSRIRVRGDGLGSEGAQEGAVRTAVRSFGPGPCSPSTANRTTRYRTTSVADPGCLSRIPDPTFFHPGSRIRSVSITDPGSSSKNLSILTPKKPKKLFLSSKKYDPGCSSRIPDPDADFLTSRIPDPGVKKAPDPVSRIRIRNTAGNCRTLLTDQPQGRYYRLIFVKAHKLPNVAAPAIFPSASATLRSCKSELSAPDPAPSRTNVVFI